MTRLRRILSKLRQAKPAALWCFEIGGVGLVAAAAGLFYFPLALLVAGLYLIVIANMEG